jgi:Zn-dependent protease
MSFVVAYDARGLLHTLFAMPFAFLIITPAFVFHEIGHKIAAQHYGYWAEYRMWTQGLMFAILIAVMTAHFGTKLLFIAPGAVYFSQRGLHFGRAAVEKVGKIGISGPIVNLALASIFGAAAALTGYSILYVGAYVNAFLVIFNLIPFAPLDGQKIFEWNKLVWVAVIGLGAVLFLLSSAGF